MKHVALALLLLIQDGSRDGPQPELRSTTKLGRFIEELQRSWGQARDERAAFDKLERAQQAIRDGDGETALGLLEQARPDLAGTPELACTFGDARQALGDLPSALQDYVDALEGPAAHHAQFNSGVASAALGEAHLAEAGVPADAQAIPEDIDPQTASSLLEAIESHAPSLEAARDHFLSALDAAPDDAARSSVAALSRRLEELDEMARFLEQKIPPPEEQPQQDQQQSEDQQEGEPPQDPQDQQPQEQPPEPQEQPGEEQEQGAPPDRPPTPRELTPEELQKLLERLAELEERARQLDKARAAAERSAPEKDW